MTKNLDFLKKMITVPGLTGFEEPIRKLIEEAWSPLTDELSVSKLGSLHGFCRGSGDSPRNSVMIATHMDAIGMIVTHVKEGFLHITEIGGIDHRILPGQMVTVHTGEEDLPGMVIQPPNHALPKEAQTGPVPLNLLRVDTGLTPQQVTRKVKIGDLVSFATEPVELEGDHIVGHSLDNRASVAALTDTLEILKKRKVEWDVWAVATTNEEETLGGAQTSGFQLRPTLAVIVDVTFGKSHDSPGHKTYEMSKGITLDWGPNTHPKLYKTFEKIAKEFEIPYQKSVYTRSSGTDAILLQVVAEGIPTMIASIPLRYMHTPIEMIDTKNIDRTARLLAEFISALDDEFMDELSWSDKEEKD